MEMALYFIALTVFFIILYLLWLVNNNTENKYEMIHDFTGESSFDVSRLYKVEKYRFGKKIKTKFIIRQYDHDYPCC